MLQEIIADQNILFFSFHAFILGAVLGCLISYKAIKKLKRKLRSQSREYDQLMNSINATSERPTISNNTHLHVIRMDTSDKKVSSLAY
jgi:positive regulator of sigma E activity